MSAQPAPQANSLIVRGTIRCRIFSARLPTSVGRMATELAPRHWEIQYVARIIGVKPLGSPAVVESGFGCLIVEMGIGGLLLWLVMATAIVMSSWKILRQLRGSPWFPIGVVIFLVCVSNVRSFHGGWYPGLSRFCIECLSLAIAWYSLPLTANQSFHHGTRGGASRRRTAPPAVGFSKLRFCGHLSVRRQATWHRTRSRRLLQQLTAEHGVDVDLYSQRVADLAVSPAESPPRYRKGLDEFFGAEFSSIPGPHLFQFIWWYFANRFRAVARQNVPRIRSRFALLAGINAPTPMPSLFISCSMRFMNKFARSSA